MRDPGLTNPVFCAKILPCCSRTKEEQYVEWGFGSEKVSSYPGARSGPNRWPVRPVRRKQRRCGEYRTLAGGRALPRWLPSSDGCCRSRTGNNAVPRLSDNRRRNRRRGLRRWLDRKEAATGDWSVDPVADAGRNLRCLQRGETDDKGKETTQATAVVDSGGRRLMEKTRPQPPWWITLVVFCLGYTALWAD